MRWHRKRVNSSRRKPSNSRQCRFESLEDRLLLSVSQEGDEFLVNQSITRAQWTSLGQSSTVVDQLGNTLVAYSGRGSADESGVFARRLTPDNPDDAPVFRVNLTTHGDQSSPVVAASDAGDFAVSWTGRGLGDHQGVFVRLFGADTTARSDEVLVNTTTGGDQIQPSISMAADGRFVVAWSGVGVGDPSGVFLRVFGADGVAVTSEQRANMFVSGEQAFPAVAMADDGSFIVSWSSRHQDGSDWGVYAQRFDSTGNRVGQEFLVNSTTAGSQWESSVTIDASGNSLVAWSSIGQNGGDSDIYGQRYDAGGTPQGGEFLVNSDDAGNQIDPSVAAAPNGGWLVSWTSGVEDGSGWEVFGQALHADGTADGEAFQINQGTSGFASGHQRLSSISVNSAGDAVAAWSGGGSTDHGGVYIQRLALAAPTVTIEPISDRTIDEGARLDIGIVASASNGATLTYSLERAPVGATINSETGVIAWQTTEADGHGV